VTQIEFADEFFFKLGALARRVGDRDLNEAAFPGVTEDPVDALARSFSAAARSRPGFDLP
jgi:hypothetical protein